MIGILKDEEFLKCAKKLIVYAKSEICISTFKAEITTSKKGQKLKEFFDYAVDAANLGVDVKILTNGKDHRGHIPDSNGYAIRWLKSTNAKVRALHDGRICHAKIIIVDRQVAIIGSHNLSVRSCHNNFEISSLIEDSTCALRLWTMFDEVWDRAKKA